MLALVERDPGVGVIEGDMREPGMSAVLHFVTDDDKPERLLTELRAAMAPGSHVLISHVVADGDAVGHATRLAASRS